MWKAKLLDPTAFLHSSNNVFLDYYCSEIHSSFRLMTQIVFGRFVQAFGKICIYFSGLV